MQNHKLGTCNDKMFAESATENTENYPTIYSAHQPKLAKTFGMFLKKVHIKRP